MSYIPFLFGASVVRCSPRRTHACVIAREKRLIFVAGAAAPAESWKDAKEKSGEGKEGKKEDAEALKKQMDELNRQMQEVVKGKGPITKTTQEAEKVTKAYLPSVREVGRDAISGAAFAAGAALPVLGVTALTLKAAKNLLWDTPRGKMTVKQSISGFVQTPKEGFKAGLRLFTRHPLQVAKWGIHKAKQGANAVWNHTLGPFVEGHSLREDVKILARGISNTVKKLWNLGVAALTTPLRVLEKVPEILSKIVGIFEELAKHPVATGVGATLILASIAAPEVAIGFLKMALVTAENIFKIFTTFFEAAMRITGAAG